MIKQTMTCSNKIMTKSNGIMIRKIKKKPSKHSNNYDNMWSVEKTQVCKHHINMLFDKI